MWHNCYVSIFSAIKISTGQCIGMGTWKQESVKKLVLVQLAGLLFYFGSILIIFFIVFYYFSDIKRHLEQVHEGRKKFKCENCGKEYTEKKGLLVHIKRIHDNIRDEQCNQCGKLFFTKEVLKGHIRNIHNKDQNPRLKCEYCQKSYSQKSYFKLHQRTIHGI